MAVQLEKPVLTAQEMADFMMRETHLISYRRANLAHIEQVNGKHYTNEVKKLMIAIQRKRKGKK